MKEFTALDEDRCKNCGCEHQNGCKNCGCLCRPNNGNCNCCGTAK